MSKTFLVGYYGMQNSGDDALLAVTAWGARKFLGAEDFVVNSPRGLRITGVGDVSPILLGKQKFPAQNRFRQYRSAIDSDRIVFGGGSVLHNARDIDLKRDLMMLSGSRGHVAVGIGIGPFVNTKAERSCRKFLQECKFVGVRDQASLDIANDIAPNANVEMTFDLAPLLLQADNFSLSQVERKGIAVCLCPKERLSGKPEIERARIESIALALESTYFYTGEPVYFIDFNGHPDLGDRQVHEEVAAIIDGKVEMHFIKYDANPHRLLQRMACFKAAICMRLHAAIFSYLAQTPAISLSYHSKNDGWCEQIGMPKDYRLGAHKVDVSQLANVLCQGLADGFKPNSLSINSAVEAALLNWRNCHDYEQSKRVEDFRCYPTL